MKKTIRTSPHRTIEVATAGTGVSLRHAKSIRLTLDQAEELEQALVQAVEEIEDLPGQYEDPEPPRVRVAYDRARVLLQAPSGFCVLSRDQADELQASITEVLEAKNKAFKMLGRPMGQPCAPSAS